MIAKAPGSLERAAIVAALIAAAVFLAISMQAAWPNTADDAYITLRYSRHLAAGEGISWNPGEAPVEGYSNFAFVVLGAALMKLTGTGDPMPWLKGIGASAAFGTLVLTFLIATRRLGRSAGAAAVLLLAVHPGLAFWAVSGMETTLGQFLVLLSVWAVFRAAASDPGSGPVSKKVPGSNTDTSNRWLLVASLALFAASITRPESPLVLAVLLLFALSKPNPAGLRSKFGTSAHLVVPFLTLYLPYTAWRLWTFGRWLPNSAACKAGYAGDPLYLGREFLGSAWPLLALGAAGLLLRRRRDYWLLLGIPLAYLGIFYGVDPIMSHLDRHFLAALPLVVLAGVFGLSDIAGRMLAPRRKHLAGVAVLIVAAVFGGASAPPSFKDVRQAVQLAHPLENLRRELAGYLQSRLGPEDAFAIGDTGLVPFLARGAVLDVYCLNCREATEPPIDRSPDRLADWILSRRPRFVVIQAVNARSERGVWPADRALQNHPRLEARYSRRRDFGDADDPLHYLVFERRTGGSL